MSPMRMDDGTQSRWDISATKGLSNNNVLDQDRNGTVDSDRDIAEHKRHDSSRPWSPDGVSPARPSGQAFRVAALGRGVGYRVQWQRVEPDLAREGQRGDREVLGTIVCLS